MQAVRGDIGDWTSHYVSDLANGTLGWLFTLGIALHGIGNLALGAGLRELADGERLGRWAALLFSVAAAGIMAVAFLLELAALFAGLCASSADEPAARGRRTPGAGELSRLGSVGGGYLARGRTKGRRG